MTNPSTAMQMQMSSFQGTVPSPDAESRVKPQRSMHLLLPSSFLPFILKKAATRNCLQTLCPTLQIATSQGPVFSADTGSQIGAQAAEIAALQAQLAEAAARLTEQRGRYKHLKGKYLRQLARQQAMHEYMVRSSFIFCSTFDSSYLASCSIFDGTSLT